VLKAAAEQVDAHDAEDEPEDEADKQHVEDGWNGLDQRVDDHLRHHIIVPSENVLASETQSIDVGSRLLTLAYHFVSRRCTVNDNDQL